MGEQQQGEAKPREGEQREAGWLARWRQRRRDNSARAAQISRRVLEADRRNIDTLTKHGIASHAAVAAAATAHAGHGRDAGRRDSDERRRSGIAAAKATAMGTGVLPQSSRMRTVEHSDTA